MATYIELQTYVRKIVQDNKYNESISLLLNQAQLEIAGGMKSTFGDFLTPPLPDLFTSDTVDTLTTTYKVTLPADFHRELFLVSNSSGVEVDIANSKSDFFSTNPLLNTPGNVYEVLDYGGYLYYKNLPASAETLTLYYYRIPVDMSADTDTPDGIPVHLQKGLLANYAIWKIGELINKENIIHETNREIILSASNRMLELHKELFFNALKGLELFISYDTRSTNFISENS